MEASIAKAMFRTQLKCFGIASISGHVRDHQMNPLNHSSALSIQRFVWQYVFPQDCQMPVDLEVRIGDTVFLKAERKVPALSQLRGARRGNVRSN